MLGGYFLGVNKKMVDECIEFNIQLYQIQQLLSRLSIPYSIDKVNDNIIHIVLWRQGEKFRLKIARGDWYEDFKFVGVLEG